jgi:Phage tail tube protein
MADVFNIPIVRLNGVDYNTKPGATLKFGGLKSEPRYASGRLSGFANEPEAAEFNGSFEVMTNSELEAVRHFRGLAEFVTDVGITYKSSNAQLTETLELTPGDGAKFKIMGDPAVMVKG